MKETPFIPTFAIVGHPNEGKSSVVATLAEDDQVPISELPGETRVVRSYPVRVDGKEILRFLDTPGFQHPQAMLEWMAQRADTATNPAREFSEAHQGVKNYDQDAALLGPLAERSGVIYVVDGSRPVRSHDLAEMEILRLCGNPRMALINLKADRENYLEDWKAACSRCFNATRVFNAVRATYAERMALLESLRSIHQDWETALTRAIFAFRENWDRRARQVAGILCDLLRDAVTVSVSRNVTDRQGEERARRELVDEYCRRMEKREQRAHEDIRRLYKHNIFHPKQPGPAILGEDLFKEKTWQLLGLNKRQIVVAAAVVGAGAGLKLDFLFGHLTFGLLTATGAAVAAAAAWLKGENMARARVQQLKLGGVQVVVGPNRNPQFPFVLLDRALLHYRSTINWAHARREDTAPAPEPEESEEVKLGFVSRWPKERRQVVLKYLRCVTRGSFHKLEQAEEKLMDMLGEVLAELAESRRA